MRENIVSRSLIEGIFVTVEILLSGKRGEKEDRIGESQPILEPNNI
jgi:hypothetical protein